MNISYDPVPSLVPFFLSDKFINLQVGPVGSTKTTASILKIAYEASRVKACYDGIRRSRAVWIRQTREQLRDTSIPDFLKWLPDGKAGRYMKTENKFLIKLGNVECEVLFRGLDDSNDVRRLLSLQATFAIADEFRELNMDVFHAMQGRLGRYPDKGMNGGGCVDDNGRPIHKFWGVTNPPDFDTPWEHYLSNPPENCAVFFQPSGLSPEADWIQYLPDGYYENLAEGKSEEWIDVYIHGKFGRSLAGKPVHTAFDPSFHVAKGDLRPIKSISRPLLLGFDFGLNPSCAISQVDMHGRLLTFAALTSDGMGVLRFIQTKLKPLLAEKFAGHSMIVIGDPAGAVRSQTDERSCFDILREEGFRVIPAKTNSPVARIAALDKFLTRQIDGGPAYLIDPGCRELINALRGNYRYKIKPKSGELEPQPEKNEASHIAEAHQYAALHADAVGGAVFTGSVRREIRKVSAKGWT